MDTSLQLDIQGQPQQQQQQQQAAQQQHTPRFRHVSAPMHQPQNLSSFQEGMRQDSVVVNAEPDLQPPPPAAASGVEVVIDGISVPGVLNNEYHYGLGVASDPLRHQHQRLGKDADQSTGHVGITLDDPPTLDHAHHAYRVGHAQTGGLVPTSYAQNHTHGYNHNLTFDRGHSPTGSPSAGYHATQLQPEPPTTTGHSASTSSSSSSSSSSRNSHYAGMFQQGYSQHYHGQLPGATLSRHLSIQLSPNSTLLPPPPPVLHSASQTTHASYPVQDGSRKDSSPLQGREYTIPPSSQHTLQQIFQHPHQQTHQQQQTLQRQPQSPSQGVAVPPPPIQYIRSPLRSPKMPQLSSQAMAHAQAQSQMQAQMQSQYRHQASHRHHVSSTTQNPQQFPPRTHRRSIQPLTLDQQQPKGGSFRFVRNQADLWPQKGSQKYRSIDAYGHSISPLRALTELLTKTYSHCNRDFKYEPSYNPRRVLTKPSKPMHNEGYDNEDYDYILYVSDILGSEERQRYLILDVLGQGTFGQVVKCQNLKTNAIVAVKVIKNRPAYFNQSMMEVTVLELLNERYDVDDRHHILRLQDTFIHRRHLCLVFELLSVNLYELIKQNQFRGLSMSLVRVFTAQLLDALCVLNEARIIHCDLKPENVLLKNLETPTIKVIDFGSACHEQQTVYTYIQSRFYRSPEVLVGLPYSSSIDIWSVGCIAAELFLGLPLFPGSSEYNQLSRIVEMLGMLPTYMLDIGKTAHEFFEVVRPDHFGHNYSRPGPRKYRLKSMETYSREHNVMEQLSKRYFQATSLPDIINSYPMLKKGMTPKEIEKETMNRQSFINFLQGLLNLNPIERWSPHQAKLHPFITGESFTGNFIPPTIPKKPATAENSTRLEPTLPGKSSKTRSASLSNSSSTPALVASSQTLQQQKRTSVDASVDAGKQDAVASQILSSKSGADRSGDQSRPSLSVLGGSMATSSEGSIESSLTDASSLTGSPAIAATHTADAGGSSLGTAATASARAGTGAGAGITFAPETGAQGPHSAQTATAALPSSSSIHHGHRPRATTMGTVEVPKNMAQLAAAMTPQQGQTLGGISGSSSLSHRVRTNDAAAAAVMFEPSSPFSMGSLSISGGSYGLRQIPERSEQSSPALEDSTSSSSNGSSRSSSVELGHAPAQEDSRLRRQHQRQSFLQQPHRYLHRSGSDGAGKARSLRSVVEGSSGYDGRPGCSDVSSSSGDVPELTPLQRMQQQLLQSQAHQHQHQQQQQQQQQQYAASLRSEHARFSDDEQEDEEHEESDT